MQYKRDYVGHLVQTIAELMWTSAYTPVRQSYQGHGSSYDLTRRKCNAGKTTRFVRKGSLNSGSIILSYTSSKKSLIAQWAMRPSSAQTPPPQSES